MATTLRQLFEKATKSKEGGPILDLLKQAGVVTTNKNGQPSLTAMAQKNIDQDLSGTYLGAYLTATRDVNNNDWDPDLKKSSFADFQNLYNKNVTNPFGKVDNTFRNEYNKFQFGKKRADIQLGASQVGGRKADAATASLTNAGKEVNQKNTAAAMKTITEYDDAKTPEERDAAVQEFKDIGEEEREAIDEELSKKTDAPEGTIGSATDKNVPSEATSPNMALWVDHLGTTLRNLSKHRSRFGSAYGKTIEGRDAGEEESQLTKQWKENLKRGLERSNARQDLLQNAEAQKKAWDKYGKQMAQEQTNMATDASIRGIYAGAEAPQAMLKKYGKDPDFRIALENTTLKNNSVGLPFGINWSTSGYDSFKSQ